MQLRCCCEKANPGFPLGTSGRTVKKEADASLHLTSHNAIKKCYIPRRRRGI